MAESSSPPPASPFQPAASPPNEGSGSGHIVSVTDCLPPWTEASREDKARIVLYTGIVYCPVAILLGVIVGVYPIYVAFYIWPMVIGGDDRPELYYWHSHSEHVRSRVIGSVCFTLSTVFLAMFVCSFYKAFNTSPGGVPESLEWRDLKTAEELQANFLKERKHTNGALRWCRRCSLVKPDRSHHCRLCDQCVLKMDHHCPWIANCVGYYNYKFFFLMLTYGMLSLWLFEGSFWETALITWRDDERGAAFSFFVTVVYSLLGILMCAVTLFWSFHIYLISSDLTTIEYCETAKKIGSKFKQSPYYRNTFDAFKSALGSDPFLWLSPFSYRTPDENGLFFTKADEVDSDVTSEADPKPA